MHQLYQSQQPIGTTVKCSLSSASQPKVSVLLWQLLRQSQYPLCLKFCQHHDECSPIAIVTAMCSICVIFWGPIHTATFCLSVRLSTMPPTAWRHWTGNHFVTKESDSNCYLCSLCDLVKICGDMCCAIPDVSSQLLGALKAICLPSSRKPGFQQLVDRVTVSMCVCVYVCITSNMFKKGNLYCTHYSWLMFRYTVNWSSSLLYCCHTIVF